MFLRGQNFIQKERFQFRYFIITLLFTVLLAGCSTSQKAPPEFSQAMGVIGQSPETALQLFESACSKGHQSSCLVLEKPDSKPPETSLSIVQGATTEVETQISVVASAEQKLEFLLKHQGAYKFVKATSIKRETWKGSSHIAYKLRFSGLSLNQKYSLMVFDSGRAVDLRYLSAFDPQRKDLKLLIASCMDDSMNDVQRVMWSGVDQFIDKGQVNFVFLIGDNVYADKGIKFHKGPADADMIWRRYAETRNRLSFYKRKTLIPTLYTWDDHDYGWNNGDQSYAYKTEAQKIFKSYWPQDDMAGFLNNGPGVASFVKLSGQKFFFLDDRSFRSANNQASGDQSHFGREQLDWVFSNVGRSREPVWLISGDQFFGAYHPWESFEGNHPEAFKSFKKRLKKLKAPVVFVSGDRHLSEIMKIDRSEIGYETYELTSSGIHAKVFPGSFKRDPNPRQVKGIDGTYNYVLVEPSLKGRKLRLKVEARGLVDKVEKQVFSHELVIRR